MVETPDQFSSVTSKFVGFNNRFDKQTEDFKQINSSNKSITTKNSNKKSAKQQAQRSTKKKSKRSKSKSRSKSRPKKFEKNKKTDSPVKTKSKSKLDKTNGKDKVNFTKQNVLSNDQKFTYFMDFSLKICHELQIKIEQSKFKFIKYKVYIQPGINNPEVIKSAFRQRFWWQVIDDPHHHHINMHWVVDDELN